jgi:RNA polymerase sigma-70 factor (family 1)
MSGYKPYSDNELIALLREGDHTAYTEIYSRYYYLMFVFAYKKLRDEDLAKDFVQELFTRLWLRRDDILENGNLAQYLYISIRSRMLNFFVHQKVESKYIVELKNYSSETSAKHSDYLIREKQLADYIEKQIQKLPTKMREVFLLSRYKLLSNREIAEKLDTTESNVSHHINNAVKILKTKLNAMLFFLFI